MPTKQLIMDMKTIQPNSKRFMGSLFSNNAQVYYKSHSLAAGGIGGVRNYRKKSKKT